MKRKDYHMQTVVQEINEEYDTKLQDEKTRYLMMSLK